MSGDGGTWRKSGLRAAGIIACLFSCYLAFVNHLEPTEVGISWNYVRGEMRLQAPGWHITPPWVAVARIDTRPMRVCITSAGRSFNCRLAQFVPSAYEEFTEVERFRYYWWANRISFNFGYHDEYRGMRDIIRGYAYSAKQYPFVVILREYKEGE